ncbi:MAG: DUF3168 domain-containing protein [Sphingomonas sp.]
MSVQELLQTAFRAALEGHVPLADAVTAIFDAPPVRGLRPYVLVEEAVLTDWGTKDMAGREARITVSLFDTGERPARLRALAGEIEVAIAAMPHALGDGWRIASLAFVRGRTLREGDERWAATSDYRVRMLRSEI